MTIQKEEMIMAGQILVPFNSHLRMKDSISLSLKKPPNRG